MVGTSIGTLQTIEDCKQEILNALQKQDTYNEDTPWPEIVIDIQHDHATWVEATHRLKEEGKIKAVVKASGNVQYVVLQVTEAGKQK